jgi:hypothetical protein
MPLCPVILTPSGWRASARSSNRAPDMDQLLCAGNERLRTVRHADESGLALLRRARDRTRSDPVERRAKLRPGAASRRLLAWRYGVAIAERGPVLLPRHRPVHEPAVRHLRVGAFPLQPRPPLVNDVRSPRQTQRDWIRRTTRRRALPDPSATATTQPIAWHNECSRPGSR